MRSAVMNTLLAATGLLLLAGCDRQDAGADPAGAAPKTTDAAPTVYESMVQTVIPHSNRIWELAGNLYGDDGNIDPGKLSAAQWKEVQDGAAAISASARALAEAKGIMAAPTGAKIQNEGTPGAPGAAAVQAAIDADPQGFRSEALKLASLADEVAAAAAAHDGVKTDDASSRLSETCSTCHSRYWYPDQGA
jgi:cytochrome c556